MSDSITTQSSRAKRIRTAPVQRIATLAVAFLLAMQLTAMPLANASAFSRTQQEENGESQSPELQKGENLSIQPPAAGTPPSPFVAGDSLADAGNEAAVSTSAKETPLQEFNSQETNSQNAEAELDSDDFADLFDENTAAKAPASTLQNSTQANDNDEPRELSVAPGSQPLLPADRPAWISEPADYASDTHRLTVSSFPTEDLVKIDSSLEEPLLAAVYQYVEDRVIKDGKIPDQLRNLITVDYIRKNLIEDPDGYVAELTTSNGIMHQKWVRLAITPVQRKQLGKWYQESLQLDRLKPLGVGVLGLLGLVGLVHFTLRKRHVMSSSEPLKPVGFVSYEQSSDRNSGQTGKSRGWLGIIAVLFMILGLPAMLVFSLLYVAVGRSERSEISTGNSVMTVRSSLQDAKNPSELEIIDFSKEGVAELVSELKNLKQDIKEKKIFSNGQQIIIRTETK